ncbi:MAG: radical SAM protein [Myxococcota bacterium]
MLALQSHTPATLANAVPELTLAEARKVLGAFYRGLPLDRPVAQVRRESLVALRAAVTTPELALLREETSALDPFVKLALTTLDARVIETVRISLERPGRYAVCLSSQVGCALGCAFCATGRLGLGRNLEAWEIVEQVRHVRRGLPQHGPVTARIHGVLFQGMGEPLANIDAVLTAIEVISEPSALAIDRRNITVCTAGLPKGILALAAHAPKARLALSVHSARPEVRRRLMPIDRHHPLDEVLLATVEHARTTRRAPLWAITLLDGVNDSDEDARAVASLAHAFTEAAGVAPQLSIVAYNPSQPTADPFAPSSAARTASFREVLKGSGIAARRRYSGGSDIGAACGQLAGERPPHNGTNVYGGH